MSDSALDALVSNPRLDPSARAVLLLRVCVVAQAVRPDVLNRYWGDVKALSSQLPASSRQSFEGLRATLEPPAPASLRGLAREVMDTLATAQRSGSDAMLAALRECEQRIGHRHWPGGKRRAWDVLVRAWIEADRGGGLVHLHHLHPAVQTNLLIRENDRAPLDAREWETAHAQSPTAVFCAIEELLERTEPHLALPAGAAEDVGKDLIDAMFRGGVDDPEAERKRKIAGDRYVKLVKLTLSCSPEIAEGLLESWFEATAATEFYAQQWLERFFALFRLVTVWSSFAQLEPQLTGYLAARAPQHLRDAVLAHAAGLSVKNAEDADAAWAALEAHVTDKESTEHWFLLTVLRAGLAEHALEMARRSPRAEQIVPCLRRAWLYEHPDSARKMIHPEDVTGDEIAEFLLRDRDGRVELLRERVRSGATLPEVMWKAPEVGDAVLGMLHGGDGPRTGGAAVGSWYSKIEPAAQQFAAFVRIAGYGHHLYGNLDPILLQTLVAWDDAHPDEVGPLTLRLWAVMRDAIKPNLRFDLVRNSIFERCGDVLGAHPATVDEFVSWIRRELVGKSIQIERVGNVIRTFQLNERAPFLFSFLAAQKVGRFSARRCDEILTNAIGKYTANDDLITAAAVLYAADKGLAGLEPPAPLKRGSQRRAWQLGVVDAALKDVLAALLSSPERGASEASSERPDVRGSTAA